MKDGSVLWASDSEQKKISEIFAIQDGITCQIVTALKVKLCGEVAPVCRLFREVDRMHAVGKREALAGRGIAARRHDPDGGFAA